MTTSHFLKAILVLAPIFGVSTLAHSQEGPSLADVARKVRAQKAAAAAADDPAPVAAPERSASPEPAEPAVGPAPAVQAVPMPETKPAPPAPASRTGTMPVKAPEPTYDKTLDATADRDLYVARISALLEQEKFKDLDDHARTLRSQRLKFPGGDWKLHTFYLIITNTLAGDQAEDADFEADLQRLKGWIADRPQSITPRVALAYVYSNWAARARRSADKADAESGRLFEERMRMAKTALAEASSLQEKCPEWFHPMLAVAFSEAWEEGKTDALLEQAIALEPLYFYNYEQYASYLLSKERGGDAGAAARFAEQIADRIGGKNGDAIYFRIAAAADCNCAAGTYLTRASWPRIRRGYEALAELEGVSNLSLNQACSLAARAGDFEYANRLFEKIGDHWEISTWRNRETFEESRSSAYSMVNMKPASQAIAVSEKTPEGRDYQERMAAILGTPQEGPFRECFRSAQEQTPNFDMVLKVARDSSIESVMFWPTKAPYACMQEKLKSITLPAPPADQYWVKVTMKLH